MTGMGVPRDQEKAAYWLRISGESGDRAARIWANLILAGGGEAAEDGGKARAAKQKLFQRDIGLLGRDSVDHSGRLDPAQCQAHRRRRNADSYADFCVGWRDRSSNPRSSSPHISLQLEIFLGRRRR